MTNEEIRVLENDPEFMDALSAAQTIEEMQDIFASKGIQASKEDIENGFELLEASFSEDGEINEEALEIVNGGIAHIIFGLAVVVFAGQAYKTYVALKNRRR